MRICELCISVFVHLCSQFSSISLCNCVKGQGEKILFVTDTPFADEPVYLLFCVFVYLTIFYICVFECNFYLCIWAYFVSDCIWVYFVFVYLHFVYFVFVYLSIFCICVYLYLSVICLNGLSNMILIVNDWHCSSLPCRWGAISTIFKTPK